ncbi:sigma 54-interacting transcriptional regulator [Desulfovibrio sp. OttesenSCG-928-C14]|nr:sigma 54-interacting transcriptional regulator [Desulfovibrio sp. OttesenSCG-928-C14]
MKGYKAGKDCAFLAGIQELIQLEKTEKLSARVEYLEWLDEISRAKERFLADGEVLGCIKPYIGESWKRSAAMMDYDTPKPVVLAGDELEALLERNKLLIKVGAGVIESICSSLDEGIYYMHLSDRNGFMLYLNEAFHQKQVNSEGLAIGQASSEKHLGTNSIALALIHQEDMIVHGAEHFLRRNETATCTTSLIRDSTGNIIGTITISFYINSYSQLLSGLSATAARLIEEQLVKNRDAGILSHVVNNSIEAVVVFDTKSRLLHCNANFLKLLSITEEEAESLDFPDVFREIDFSRFSAGQYEDPKEMSLHYKDAQFRVNVHARAIYSDNELVCFVVFCQEITSLIYMSRKLTGKTNYYTFKDIVTGDADMRRLMEQCRRIADLDIPVLISGESGVGKELFAQSMHSGGSRAQKPFMAVNCAALPLHLIESELFGYEKGAFTGAQSNGKPGKFELANGGTIFLDEIGELPLDIQAKLLRVLDNYKISRIGGTREKTLDVRVIAATNRDLAHEVENKNFRADLFYRLNVMTIHIPQLSRREGDIELLAGHFIGRLNAKHAPEPPKFVTDEAMRLLTEHNWPGNVREFQNALVRAYYLCDGQQIAPGHFSFQGGAAGQGRKAAQPGAGSVKKTRQQLEIEEALDKSRGKVAPAAKALGIPLSSLYRKIGKYGVNIKDYI